VAPERLTTEDLLELQNLIADYVLSVDARDLERFRELWTADAVVHVNRDHVGLGAPLHGREAIVAAFAAYFERGRDAAPGTFIRHFCTNPRLEIVDGGVTGLTAMLAIRQQLMSDGIDIRPSRTGTYSDRFVRDSDRWRFASRTIAWDPPERAGVTLPVALYGAIPR
jgi:ketosteroid isomerase-like protein